MTTYTISRVEHLNGRVLVTESERMNIHELAVFVGGIRRAGTPYAYHPGMMMGDGYYVTEYSRFHDGILDPVQVIDLVAPELERQRLKEASIA